MVERNAACPNSTPPSYNVNDLLDTTLAEIGKLTDIPLVERLQRDDDKDVRTQAEQTMRLIHFKADPDSEVKKSIDRNEPFDDELIKEIARKVDGLSVNTLKLALKHPNGGLRALAAREMLQRGHVTADLARQMCADEAKAVRECGYLARVRSGETFKTSDIRTGLKEEFSLSLSSPPDWNKADPDKVVSEYFDRVSQEGLWKHVDAFNEDSHLALAAIGRRFFKENATTIRAELENDFEKRAQAAKSVQPKLNLAQTLFGEISETGISESVFCSINNSYLSIQESKLLANVRRTMEFPVPIPNEKHTPIID